MAEEFEFELSVSGKAAEVVVTGSVLFARHLDDRITRLTATTGGRATSETHRSGTLVTQTITVEDLTVAHDTLPKIVESWFETQLQEFKDLAWTIRSESRRGAVRVGADALAVHSPSRPYDHG